MTSRENIESWFHEDDGIVSPANTLTQQKGTNNAQVKTFPYSGPCDFLFVLMMN